MHDEVGPLQQLAYPQALLLGVLEVLIPAYLPGSYTGYKDAVAFVALIVILLVKPSGLLGSTETDKV